MNSPEDFPPSAPRGPARISFLFQLTAAAVGLFVVTILALGADLFGNPNAPVAKFLSRYGTHLILAEVALILVLGVAAMRYDKIPPLQPPMGPSPPGEQTAESSGEESDLS